MVSNIQEKPLKLYNDVPKKWCGWLNYRVNPESVMIADGWRDFVYPEYDPAIQKQGDLIYDEERDVVTFGVIDKTPEEIKDYARAVAEQLQREQGDVVKVSSVLSEIQTWNDTKAKANAAIYPVWSKEALIEEGDKFQAFNSSGTLSLFKALNPVTGSVIEPKEDTQNWTEL